MKPWLPKSCYFLKDSANEKLYKKIVLLFKLYLEQLSSQSHYDFGFRALKPVLVPASNVKRDRIQKIREKSEMIVDEVAENSSIEIPRLEYWTTKIIGSLDL